MNEADHLGKKSGRRAFLTGALAGGLAASLSRMIWAAAPEVGAAMARAAQAWLDGLSRTQQPLAQLAWDSPWRENWHYRPRRRPGVILKNMRDRQLRAAWDLIGALVSSRGLQQVRGVIKLEAVLGELTGNTSFRDPDNYALVIFGDPAGSAPWAWRFEGHHISLSVVVVPGAGVATTPAFFGANPATVPESHSHRGFRLLGAEEDTAFSLVRSLEGSARALALIENRSLGDIVAGPGREDILSRPEGAGLTLLNEAQRAGVMRLLELFIGTMRDEIAAAVMARVREAGVEQLRFAWAGSLVRGRPHYFRVQGPTALIEYDNTQNEANHVHSVWIDPVDVFGRDLLKKHHDQAH